MKKMMKRLLAVLLAASRGLSACVQALAAPGNSPVQVSQVISGEGFREKMMKEQEEARRKSSPLYAELLRTNGEPQPITSVLDEGADWAEEYRLKTAEQGVNVLLDTVKDSAKDRIKHLYRRSPNYYDTKNALADVADTIDSFGSFMGLTDALSKFPEVLKLQGDTVEEQMMELTVLTAQFGIAAFSVIGMSIGFPWGMILSLVLELLLDVIRSGAFDGVFPSDEEDGDTFGSTRYKLPDGTNVLKPNIYIYSQEEREVTVSFDQPELLTVTIPEYQGDWKVTADAEGRLTDASGETYDFLFYESVSEAFYFETEEGWRIPAEEREERLEQILTGLGFQGREITDFTEFWTEKLDPDTDYLMYPQGTERVDLAMPVTITEEPECLERIWFVFTEDDGRSVEEPAGYELTRGGEGCRYYVLEWGGLVI